MGRGAQPFRQPAIPTGGATRFPHSPPAEAYIGGAGDDGQWVRKEINGNVYFEARFLTLWGARRWLRKMISTSSTNSRIQAKTFMRLHGPAGRTFARRHLSGRG